ncbi:hypothetical protein GOV03_00480 [Candidatus Woesearchaeota archaeon]|nr:hypothetical protein [Candidatus Woesearchaeota archaeon]
MAEIIDRKVSYSELECLYLDLKVISVLGFEDEKFCTDIEEIIEGIHEGAEFPPVFLVPVGEPDKLQYRLTQLDDYHDISNLGGHHRSVAHYLENKLLRCLILEPSLVEPYDGAMGWSRLFFPIEDIILI